MNGWKVAAIILLIIALAEGIFIGWAWKTGTGYLEMKSECMYNVCSGYESFLYDSYYGVCYCYKDNEIAKEVYIG